MDSASKDEDDNGPRTTDLPARSFDSVSNEGITSYIHNIKPTFLLCSP